MAKEKKAAGADKKRNSNANANYIASGRRYTNKIKKVKKHIARTGDQNAKRWLNGAMKIFSQDYKRGAEVVRKIHEEVYS